MPTDLSKRGMTNSAAEDGATMLILAYCIILIIACLLTLVTVHNPVLDELTFLSEPIS